MKKFFVLFLAILFVSVSACKNPFFKNMLDEDSGSEGSGDWNSQSSDFVLVTSPVNGIVGVAPDYPLPGSQDYWKGVFIAGRTVKLSPYMIGKTEVTYVLWYEVLAWAEHKGYTFANSGREGSHGTDGAAPTANKNHPVTMVSWRDCIVWCNAYTEKEKGIEHCVYRKSKTDTTVLKDATNGADCDAAYADMDKKGFRLPTEAEWEYAARRQNDNTNATDYGEGGSNVWLTKLNSASGAKKPIGFSGLTLPEGETWESLRDEVTRVAVYDEWFDGSNWVDQPTAVTKTGAVKSKDANALGLYDMSGNVWEWCFDWYDNDPASNDAAYEQGGIVTDPQGGASDTNRVLRGGSWDYDAYYCTVGIRGNSSPGNRGSSLGFRLACRH